MKYLRAHVQDTADVIVLFPAGGSASFFHESLADIVQLGACAAPGAGPAGRMGAFSGNCLGCRSPTR
jgi:hypothetical protein